MSFFIPSRLPPHHLPNPYARRRRPSSARPPPVRWPDQTAPSGAISVLPACPEQATSQDGRRCCLLVTVPALQPHRAEVGNMARRPRCRRKSVEPQQNRGRCSWVGWVCSERCAARCPTRHLARTASSPHPPHAGRRMQPLPPVLHRSERQR